MVAVVEELGKKLDSETVEGPCYTGKALELLAGGLN